MAAKALPQATKAAIGAPTGNRTGIVTKVDATGVYVNIAGAVVPCGVIGTTAGIAVGATVIVSKQDQSWMVTGASNGGGNLITNTSVLKGSILLNSGINLVTGLTSGSGEVTLNQQIGVVTPLNHLIQIKFLASWFGSVVNSQLLSNIRDGVGGTVKGSDNKGGAIAGDGYQIVPEAWFRGDGAAHTYTATVQNLASGTITVYEGAGGLLAAFDWGDATGVTNA